MAATQGYYWTDVRVTKLEDTDYRPLTSKSRASEALEQVLQVYRRQSSDSPKHDHGAPSDRMRAETFVTLRNKVFK